MRIGRTTMAGAAIFVLGHCQLFGQQTPMPSGNNEITEKFFLLYEEGKPAEAVDYVFGSNPYMSRKADDVQNLRTQLANMVSLLGEYRGNEKITEKTLRSRFVHLVYLAYHDRQPVRFTFQFYKPRDAWMTYTFTFEDRFAAELTEAAKADFISPPCAKTD